MSSLCCFFIGQKSSHEPIGIIVSVTTATSAFVRSAESIWQEPAPGIRRQVLAHGRELMLVRVEFDAGAIGDLHHHSQRQSSYVAAGRFAVSIGGEQKILV